MEYRVWSMEGEGKSMEYGVWSMEERIPSVRSHTRHTRYAIRHTPRSRGLPAPARALRAGAQAGMTMLEVIVWISVLSAVLLAITTSLLYFHRINKYAIQQSSAVTSAQRGLESAIRVMREASYSSQGAFPVVSIGANDFAFYADVNTDALVEKVRYYVSGTSFMQGITNASGDPPGYTSPEVVYPLSDYIRNIDQSVQAFRYYDASGVEITDYAKWADARFVQVSLVVNVDPNKLPNQLVLTSSAALRNLK